MSPRQTTPACSNAERHQPHPSGYFACSAWAGDALLVADQRRCPGCGRFEIWTPKRADVRIAVNWPPPNCDWGSCDGEGVAERYAAELNAWLPVCAEHLEVGVVSGWDGVTVVAADGPLAGRRLRWRSTGWPTRWCGKDPAGVWRHYVHVGDGRFEQRGDCAPWQGCEPLDDCGRVWTGREVHGRHVCIEAGRTSGAPAPARRRP